MSADPVPARLPRCNPSHVVMVAQAYVGQVTGATVVVDQWSATDAIEAGAAMLRAFGVEPWPAPRSRTGPLCADCPLTDAKD